MNQDEFQKRNKQFTDKMSADPDIKEKTQAWFHSALEYEYHYHFSWLGLPIIQFPSDIVAMQEIIWDVKPDLIIETGIARGGSLIFYASMLELLGGDGHVVGIDIDIRSHNREAIEQHPMFKRVTMIEGSSIDEGIVDQVKSMTKNKKCVMVVLDSNHTHDHALAELQAYAPLVSQGSYAIVFDTVIEDIPAQFNQDRPWGKGNSPKTAVHEFLKTNRAFEIDRDRENKLLVTVAPDGFLKRVE